MTHFNFSRWREKTVRRASGEPDEGPGHELRFLLYFRALALNWRGSRAVFSRQREKLIADRKPRRVPVSRLMTVGISCLQKVPAHEYYWRTR